MRCHREVDDVESVEVGHDNYQLCHRCANTFWNMFQRFMASCVLKGFGKRSKNVKGINDE